MNSQSPKPSPLSLNGASAVSRADAAELSSEKLLRGRREVLIRHGADQYRLRLTRMNKLILTK